MSWERGRDEILDMLERGELDRVIADLAMAERLITSARRHLDSADQLHEDDPELAYAAIHDAIRKAMAAMLQAQGLRARTTGGHLAVQHAVRAQFGSSMGRLLRPVDRIRTTRHKAEYPDIGTSVDSDAVMANLPAARELVDAAEKVIPHLTVFGP